MEELVGVMKEILAELQSMNKKLDTIAGNGLFSLEDIHSELCTLEEAIDESGEKTVKDIKGAGPYDTITDICKLITSNMDSLRGNGRYNSLSEIGDRISRAQDEIMGPGPYNSIADIYDNMKKQDK